MKSKRGPLAAGFLAALIVLALIAWPALADFTGFDSLALTGNLITAGTGTFGGNITSTAGNISTTAGNISSGGTLAVTGATTHTNDVTISADTTGGDAGAKNELIGLPRIKLIGLGQGTDGTGETTIYMDDTPDGEWAPTENVTEALDTTHYKLGSASYKAIFAAAAVASNGITRTITGDNLEANESVGMFVMASEPLAAGDLTLVLTDDGGDRTFNIPAVATANKWTWVEVDISSLAAGTGDSVSVAKILLSSAGATAHGAFTVYLDGMVKWDATDEDALGVAIQQDGVLSVTNTETGAQLAEGTDYFVHYESGNDFLVWVTNQSAADIAALVAY